MDDIYIHTPFVARAEAFPTVALFYDRLFETLPELGLNPIRVEGKDKALRRDRSKKHLVYHTRFKRTGAHGNVKIGYLPDFLYLDPEGFAGWSSIRREAFDPVLVDAEEAEAFDEWLGARYRTPRLSKIAQAEEVEAVPEGCIAVFLQVHGDEVLNLARVTSDEMIRAVIAHRGGRPVVIKPHPACRAPETLALLATHVSERNGVYASRANIHDIFRAAHRVVCVNSGTGFEALLYGLPVSAFGRTDYRHAASVIGDNGGAAEVLGWPGRDADFYRRYLYWFLNGRLIRADGDDFTARLKAQLGLCGLL